MIFLEKVGRLATTDLSPFVACSFETRSENETRVFLPKKTVFVVPLRTTKPPPRLARLPPPLKMRSPRAPNGFALCDLFENGFLNESDVMPGGHVDETVRIRAERAYADFLEAHRPSTAPPSRGRPLRIAIPQSTSSHNLTPRSRNAPLRRNNDHAENDTQRRVPTHRTTSAHVYRMAVRQALSASEREHTPKTLVVDMCCVCLARPRNHAFDPCFHMCVCASCAPKVTHCPMCRVEATCVHRIFV